MQKDLKSWLQYWIDRDSFFGVERVALTPEAFQAAALAWIAAMSLVLTALAGAVAKLWPLIQGFRDQSLRLDDHSRRITANSQKVTDIALEVKPPDKEEKT